MVAEKVSIPKDKVSLVVTNKCISQDSEGTLEDYDIQHTTTIHFVQRAVGGGNSNSRSTHSTARASNMQQNTMAPSSVTPRESTQQSVPTTGKCMLTRTEHQISALLKLSCGHVLSKIALVDYINKTVSKTSKLICPCCKKGFDHTELEKAGLTDKKMQEMLKKIETDVMFKTHSCKRCPQCDTWTQRIHTDRLRTECHICSMSKKFEFCWSCLNGWKNASDNSVCGNKICNPTNKEMLDILATCNVKSIGDIEGVPAIRACPKCRIGISHVGGCKHVYCTNCQTDFCFSCLRIKEGGSWPSGCGSYDSKCKVAKRQTFGN